MGLFDWLRRKTPSDADNAYGVEELAGRLGLPTDTLQTLKPQYNEFTVPKSGGGTRPISAPTDDLKQIQRKILRRLLKRLKSHPCATGFEGGHSIATNAHYHTGQAVVLRMDIKNFFGSTTTKRVATYFRKIGWNRQATELLVKLTTHKGVLPQGAPTSPRLSNLVNCRLDARLAGLAGRFGARYSRYADDMTFSFSSDRPNAIRDVIRATKAILQAEGYKLHTRRKLHIRRRHNRQLVTGLVVNDRPNLPRETRRRLRAIEHRMAIGEQATLTPAQLEGWKSLQTMIINQTSD